MRPESTSSGSLPGVSAAVCVTPLAFVAGRADERAAADALASSSGLGSSFGFLAPSFDLAVFAFGLAAFALGLSAFSPLGAFFAALVSAGLPAADGAAV
jgi:hypothetical protein